MTPLIWLRAEKAWYAMTRPQCWKSLLAGVAPSIEHGGILRRIDCDLLLDVGANRGQFSLMMRLVHPRMPIEAFEPLPSEAAVYRRLLCGEGHVTLHEVALGDCSGAAEMHLSRQADSSSLLAIAELQPRLFPHTEEIGTHKVHVATLDSFAPIWHRSSRALLKIDVQGFEMSVLRGSVAALAHCAWVYVECSEVPLYEGQALSAEVTRFLVDNGFTLTERLNEYWSDETLIQADYLFARV